MRLIHRLFALPPTESSFYCLENKPWYLQVEPQKPSPYIQRRIEKHNDSLDPLNDLNKMMHYKLIHDDPTYAEAVQNSTVTPKTSAYYDKSKPVRIPSAHLHC